MCSPGLAADFDAGGGDVAFARGGDREGEESGENACGGGHILHIARRPTFLRGPGNKDRPLPWPGVGHSEAM